VPVRVSRIASNLKPAELVAFDAPEPTMRSRGGITAPAKQRAADEAFREGMATMFSGAPTSRLDLMTFAGVVRRWPRWNAGLIS
jgi:hypothetical protein